VKTSSLTSLHVCCISLFHRAHLSAATVYRTACWLLWLLFLPFITNSQMRNMFRPSGHCKCSVCSAVLLRRLLLPLVLSKVRFEPPGACSILAPVPVRGSLECVCAFYIRLTLLCGSPVYMLPAVCDCTAAQGPAVLVGRVVAVALRDLGATLCTR
jgi:hypothetical protein